tara:strand:+ start:46 stop:993 length:948 start_codon:yes stop_codon:yes gene_type:complete
MNEFIESIITTQKPYLKQTSISQYVKSIDRLAKALKLPDEPVDSFNFIKDAEKVELFLSKFSFTTRRNYYSAIITLLQSETTPDKDLIKSYSKIVRDTNDQYTKQNESGIVSEKQQEKLVSYEKIMELLASLKREKSKMEYILFKLLSIYHLRNEVATLQKISPTEYKKLTKEQTDGNNYLVMGTKKITIYRNDYKTNKKYGTIKIDITDKDFMKELRDYTDTLTDNIVFPYNEEMMTKKRLTNHLMYHSRKHIGIGLSTTMLAKSILSHKYAEGQSQQKEDAAARGHSVGIQNNIYVKRLPEEEADKEFLDDSE